MLFRGITSLEVSNFDKEFVKSRLLYSAYVSFNPLTTSVPHHIETSQLICNALSRFPIFLRKIFPERRLKHLSIWTKVIKPSYSKGRQKY